MKSLLKWLAIAILLVVLLPIVIGVLVSVFIDPNDFKPQIIALVEKNTRGALKIDGTLGWSFFPSIGVDLNQVQFRLPEDGEKPFANLDTVKLGVKLLPLLRGAVEADGLEVDGLRLQLKVDAKGMSNWEQIVPEKEAAAPAATLAEDNSNEIVVAPLAIAIAKISIQNSAIHYVDQQAEGGTYALNDVNFESTNINLGGKPFPLDMQFNVELGDPKLRSDSRIKGELSANGAAQQFAIDGIDIDLLLRGEPFGDKTVNLNLTGKGQFNAKADTLTLDQLKIDLANALKASLQLSGEQVTNKPLMKGQFDVESFDANKLLVALGMETMVVNNPTALSAISLNGTIGGPANSFLMNPLTIKLDGTTLKGQLGIKDLETSEYVIQLQGDQINLDDYSAPEVEGEGEQAAAAESQPNAALLPLATLQPLLFNAQFGFNTVTISGLKLSDMKMIASGNKGLIKLKSLAAKLYGGVTETNAVLDARSDSPSIKINSSLSGVNLKPLLTDFAEVDTLTGTANFNAKLALQGNSSAALQKSLSGPVTFNINEAVLSKLNMDKLLCQSIAQVRQKELTKTDWPATTQFQKIGGTLQFNEGVGNNDDLTAALENMQVTGKGVLDLPQEAVDYRVGLRISGDLSEQDAACEINEQYRDIVWPMRCKGKLSDEPGDMCGIDKKGLTKVAKKLLKNEAKRRLSDKLLKKLGGDDKDKDADGEEDDPNKEAVKKLLDKLF
ncbi:MAG: AsmA family protein [Pseudomonadales bacterium]